MHLLARPRRRRNSDIWGWSSTGSKSMVSCPGRCVPVKEFCKQAKAEIEETTEKLKFYYRTFKRANGILQKKKLNKSLKIGDIKLKKRVEHLKTQLNIQSNPWVTLDFIFELNTNRFRVKHTHFQCKNSETTLGSGSRYFWFFKKNCN